MENLIKELQELLSKYHAEIHYQQESYSDEHYVRIWIETPDGDNKEIHWAKFDPNEGITPTSIPYEIW